MSGTTGTIPLQPWTDDQLITKEVLNGENANIASLMDANGCGGHSDTDSDMQITTNPYPGSVLSKPASIAGELERIRYQIAQILGTDWYKSAANGNNLANIFITGEVRPFAGSSVPTGFLNCDGASVLRTDYPALFSAIGTTWGSADGTHFTIPDLRGRTLLGSGTGSGLTARALGATGGEETHALTTPELASHNHSATDAGHAHGITDPAHHHSVNVSGITGAKAAVSAVDSASHGLACTAGATVDGYASKDTDTHDSHQLIVDGTTGVTVNSGTASITVGSTGSGTAHNNMQPWACVKYIIKT